MSTRNFEEYRAEVLEQLGATAEDLRNEPSWRAKVLEALGAEYTDEDTRNFERYRLKVLENLSGGGGSSWQTVFEGSVTTEQSEMGNIGYINYNEQLTADTLKITFDGIEYECEKTSTITSNMYGGFGEDGLDFSEYPFLIMSTEDENRVFTESAGTHTLKIEEPQSGGGDFSIVEVELHYTLDGAEFIPDTAELVLLLPYPENAPSTDAQYLSTMVLTGNDKAYPILYKGEGLCTGISAYKNDVFYVTGGEPTLTGDIELGEGGIIINGNGSITVPLVQD